MAFRVLIRMKNFNMITNKKVILGISGGVDSTAAALMLREEGYEVAGLFLDVTGEGPAEDAEKIAELLNINYICKDVSSLFRERIINYFCRSYLEGITPNPCVYCNPDVKFRLLADTADEMGIAYIATGHYAKVCFDSSDQNYYIHTADYIKKDQSYMLYRLGQNFLRRLLLPLGTVSSKREVREYLKTRGMPGFDKSESQEICFIKGMRYAEFLKNKGYDNCFGQFTDIGGNTIGEHNGIFNYTVGQRKNLGRSFGKPRYVISIDAVTKQVVLGDEKDLYRDVIHLADPTFAVLPEGKGNMPKRYDSCPVNVKIRYAAVPHSAILAKSDDGSVRIKFHMPQRAPAPGQSAVFYDGTRLIGGGIIRAL